MIVLACDPGFANVGWALLDLSGRRPRALRCHTQRTLLNLGHLDRMRHITEEWMSLVYLKEPVDLFVLEDQAPGQIAARKRGATNAAAALARDVQHQLWGSANSHEIPASIIAPRTWRSRLGLTRATDAEIKRAVRTLCDDVPKRLSIHAAEAICIGIAGGRSKR